MRGFWSGKIRQTIDVIDIQNIGTIEHVEKLNASFGLYTLTERD